MRITLPKDQIIDRMKFDNCWWKHRNIDAHYNSMKRREYFDLFYPLVEENAIKRAVVLKGPRRVGKTVLLFHTIQQLIDFGVSPKRICYLSIETPIYNGIGLEQLIGYFREAVQNNSKELLYIFFDEIQYLKNWEIHLKSLVDSYHNIKFVVSGSAAAALKLKSIESGAGRFTDFVLPPLTFHEYLSLKNLGNLVVSTVGPRVPGDAVPFQRNFLQYKVNDMQLLNKYFIDYMNFGGYPEVSLSIEIQSNPGRYIRNDIVDKVLMRDLPLLYGIDDIQELNSFFTYIAFNTGAEMSLESISQSSGVSKNTIKKYITYLEAAFLIKVIQRVENSGKKFKRANFFKIYLTNPSLRCALFSPVNATDVAIGNMVETAIYSQWQHTEVSLYYARWDKGEVDMVHLGVLQKPDWLVEIKWSNKYAQPKYFSELKNIRSFSAAHNIYKPTVTTIDIHELKEVDGIEVDFIPASLYCYMIGRNAVYNKINRIYRAEEHTDSILSEP
jgi:uncharacterized protein